MITVYGLNKKIGNISFYDSSGRDSFTKPYSEATAKTIDEEVHNLIEDCYKQTKKLLLTHKEKLTKLAELLLEKEVIFKEDLLSIFGPRPWDKEEEKVKKTTNKIVKKEKKSDSTKKK